MSAKNCIICGYYSSRPFCSSCEDMAEKYLDRICDFLKTHYRPTVMEVYAETFIPLPVIYGLKDMGWVEIIPTDGELFLAAKIGKFLSKEHK